MIPILFFIFFFFFFSVLSFSGGTWGSSGLLAEFPADGDAMDDWEEEKGRFYGF